MGNGGAPLKQSIRHVTSLSKDGRVRASGITRREVRCVLVGSGALRSLLFQRELGIGSCLLAACVTL